MLTINQGMMSLVSKSNNRAVNHRTIWSQPKFIKGLPVLCYRCGFSHNGFVHATRRAYVLAS